MNNRTRKLREKIIGLSGQLKESNFYQIDFISSFNRCLTQLGDRKIHQIICYGLGSFCDGIDVTSRYQLALLLLMYEFLLCHPNSNEVDPVIEIYDPSFNELDVATLTSFFKPKFKLIVENEYCGRRLDSTKKNSCILIYMPHLDKYLYNNLIGVNWDVENLSRLVILGNSFREMIDSETSLKCEQELYYMNLLVRNFKNQGGGSGSIKKKKDDSSSKEKSDQVIESSQESLIEISIDDNSFDHSDIFNSLSFQFLNSSWLKCNHRKIQQNYLMDWTCVTSQTPDDWS